jgi:hypothetical protein
MTTAVQLRKLQATPTPAASYDLFSRDGHACCAKLDDESVKVFDEEEDEPMTKVTVSWSNGMSCSGNLPTASCHDSSNASLDTEDTISCSTFTDAISLKQGLDAVQDARLKLM